MTAARHGKLAPVCFVRTNNIIVFSIRKDDDSRMRRRQQQAATMSKRNQVSLDIETNGDDLPFLEEPTGKSPSVVLSPRSYSGHRRIYVGGLVLVVTLLLWLSPAGK
jgi:hypothetical protein